MFVKVIRAHCVTYVTFKLPLCKTIDMLLIGSFNKLLIIIHVLNIYSKGHKWQIMVHFITASGWFLSQKL